ncbi:cell division protein ZapA [Aceticella autotrophica]|uniref:Cell division protein ZapA n=1 Tax=Aceticella autotrophica TaxID=2755338 RepID=A0A975GB27_9THEO|nr:cell division protein ZapA [Aceticella autotrophica]QSZ27895.1 cell division protein ZapA [Aceticella autotrophica]
MGINKVTVNINGNDYILKSDYPEDYILKLTEYVNTIIKEISNNYRGISLHTQLVLTALNVADELFISREENNALKKQILILNSELDKKSKMIEDLNEKLEKAKDELERSKNELLEYIKTFDNEDE